MPLATYQCSDKGTNVHQLMSLTMFAADTRSFPATAPAFTTTMLPFPLTMEADSMRGVPRADSLPKNMCHEANKANEYARHDERKRRNEWLIPYPVPITVNLREGSPIAEINGQVDELMLNT